jgi:hypothetical protein
LYDGLVYAAKTIGWKGSGTSELNYVVQNLLLSRWDRNRKVRLLLDLPDLGNYACTLIEQGDDLLIGIVYLLPARCKSSFGVGDLLRVAFNRSAKQKCCATTATQDCNQSGCCHYHHS